MKNSEKGEYVNYRSYLVLSRNSNNARYELFFTNHTNQNKNKKDNDFAKIV